MGHDAGLREGSTGRAVFEARGGPTEQRRDEGNVFPGRPLGLEHAEVETERNRIVVGITIGFMRKHRPLEEQQKGRRQENGDVPFPRAAQSWRATNPTAHEGCTAWPVRRGR